MIGWLNVIWLALAAGALLIASCQRDVGAVTSPEKVFEIDIAADWRPRPVEPALAEQWHRTFIACAPQRCATPGEGAVAGWTLPRRTDIRSLADVKARIPAAEAHRVLRLALSRNMNLNPEDFRPTDFGNGAFGWSARRLQPHDGAGTLHYAALMVRDNEAVALDLWIPQAYEAAAAVTIRDLESRVRVIAPAAIAAGAAP